MIPAFETDPGEEAHYQLPPGVHVATWTELVERFGTNERWREAQKAKFGDEMFIANAPGNRFLDFFQLDRDGGPKGIIQINLTDIP